MEKFYSLKINNTKSKYIEKYVPVELEGTLEIRNGNLFAIIINPLLKKYMILNIRSGMAYDKVFTSEQSAVKFLKDNVKIVYNFTKCDIELTKTFGDILYIFYGKSGKSYVDKYLERGYYNVE